MKLMISGGTGYIGSMLTKHILRNRNDIKVVVPVRNMEKARSMFPDNVEYFEVDFMDREAVRDAFSEKILGDGCDYIVHCACVTSSGEMNTHPVETTAAILKMTETILEVARRWKEAGMLKSMVYLSSMEVYGNMDCTDGHRASEEEAGFVDPLLVRSCYPMGKRMAENMCYSYFKEYGVPVRIARLAQTFGHGVLADDGRVFAQFARAAAQGKDIVLHTNGSSVGNYCGIDDTVKGILKILEYGRDGDAYNVVNEENTMTIRDMAELVAKRIAGGKIRVVYDIPADNKYGYAADTGLRMSGEKLRSLGWEPVQTLTDMYQDMLDDLTI